MRHRHRKTEEPWSPWCRITGCPLNRSGSARSSRQESSRNALIDARCAVAGASDHDGATIPLFGGSGDACGGARLLQPP